MKENYRIHEAPETSLVFGLGIPFLAFANAVDCWDEDDLRVRDGFGFIDWQRYQKTFGDDFFSSVGKFFFLSHMTTCPPTNPFSTHIVLFTCRCGSLHWPLKAMGFQLYS